MEDRHRDKLKKNRVYLVTNITNVDDILDHLLASGVLTESMKETVESKSGKRSQVRELLDIVPCRGPEAFHKFIQALKDTENGFIVRDKLNDHTADQTDVVQVTQPVESSTLLNRDEVLPQEWPDENICACNVKPFNIPQCDKRMKDKYMQINDTVYTMKHKPRGVALIVNNFLNKSTDKLCIREGTDLDEIGLDLLFKGLFFHVDIHTDKTVPEMKSIFEKTKQHGIHNDADCFVLVLLSHGSSAGVFGVDGNLISHDEIRSAFNGRNFNVFKDKPKLVFIQACRGKTYDHGADEGATGVQDGFIDIQRGIQNMTLGDTQADCSPAVSATNADFIMVCSTTDEMVSFRNTKKGSWFIQAIIYLFRTFSHTCDLKKMLTRVNHLVKKGVAMVSETGDKSDKKLSVTISETKWDTLSKDLYFFPNLSEDKTYQPQN